MNLSYTTHRQPIGVYGERVRFEWNTLDRRPIASMEQADQGYIVTLWNEAGTSFPRPIQTEKVAYAICEAHRKERGFDYLARETSDNRSYND